MNIPAPHPAILASQVPLENLAGNRNISDDEKVGEVSRQFEAVLLRQILQEIRKPVLAPAEGDASVNGIYGDMVNNQMAESISQSGGFGLAKSLASQLSHQVLSHPAESMELSHASAQTALIHKKSSK